VRFQLRGGRAAVLRNAGVLGDAETLVAAHLDGRRGEATIFLAAPITQAEIETHFGDQITAEDVIAWDDDAGIVRARRQERLGAVVLKDGPLPGPPPMEVARALLDGIRERGLDALPWTKTALRLRERIGFLHRQAPDTWPDVSDDALLASLDDWLLPHLVGMKRIDDLRRLDLVQLLYGLVGWDRRAELDRLAPTHLTVPSGSNIPIDYSDGNPVLAVRLQEVFGLQETPRVGGVPLTLHLLSPAQRPVQVTQDLASFWRDAYFDVRKDMRGRYPKHPWPEDPLSATPTNRTKRRR
jgi:ATP-dependent helicase HrpB